MSFSNQPRPLHPRLQAHEVKGENKWIVDWRGGTYFVIDSGLDFGYRIYRRGTPGLLQIVEPKHDLGKEEAFDWIEKHCM